MPKSDPGGTGSVSDLQTAALDAFWDILILRSLCGLLSKWSVTAFECDLGLSNNSNTHMYSGYIWPCSVQEQFILGTFRACANRKWFGHRAKRIKIWDSVTISSTYVCFTFELAMFKVICSHSVYVSQNCPVARKRLVIQRNVVKCGTMATMAKTYMGYLWPCSVQGQLGFHQFTF